VNALIGTGGTDASYSSAGGVGVRGMLFRKSGNFEFGPSLGIIRGPSSEVEARTSPNGGGPDVFTKITHDTRFIRLLAEGRWIKPLSRRARFQMGLGAGYANGSIEREQEIASGGMTTTDDSFGGFTWEISPGLGWDLNAVWVEFGLRYAQFPSRDADASIPTDFEWNPIGLFAAVMF
jgi:hypothetical protein